MTSRRVFLRSAGSAVLVAAGSSSSAASAAPDRPGLDLSGLEREQGVRIGVAAVCPEGRRLSWRSDERFAFCSTGKTYIAGAVLHQVDVGALDLRRRIRVTGLVDGSPVTGEHGSMTVAELCRAALTVSDNTAANLLVGLLGGPDRVTAFARRLGDGRTRADRLETELNEAAPGDPRDTSTPAAFATGYRQLLLGHGVSRASRLRLLHWMRATETSEKRFRAGVPDGWTTADKTGTGQRGTTNDAGLLLAPRRPPILLVVFSDVPGGAPDAPANEGVIAETTRRVVAAFARAR